MIFRRMLLLTNLILLGLLAWAVRGIILEQRDAQPAARAEFLPVSDAAPVSAQCAAKPQPARETPPRHHALIVERNIFASADAPAAAPPAEPVMAVATEAPTEPLHLKLIGTIAGDPDVARAVIENTQSKTQRSCRIGDEVQGAVVLQILRNRVVLVRDGREVALDVSIESPEPLPPAPVREAPSAYAQAGNLTDVVKVTASGVREIDKAALAAKGSTAAAALRATRFEPHVVDGQIAGVRLSGIADFPVAGLAGLKDGDVITSINSQQLTNLPKAFQVMRKARKQPLIDVELLRGAEKKTLAFSVR